jgi:hypothetical protein
MFKKNLKIGQPKQLNHYLVFSFMVVVLNQRHSSKPGGYRF